MGCRQGCEVIPERLAACLSCRPDWRPSAYFCASVQSNRAICLIQRFGRCIHEFQWPGWLDQRSAEAQPRAAGSTINLDCRVICGVHVRLVAVEHITIVISHQSEGGIRCACLRIIAQLDIPFTPARRVRFGSAAAIWAYIRYRKCLNRTRLQAVGDSGAECVGTFVTGWRLKAAANRIGVLFARHDITAANIGIACNHLIDAFHGQRRRWFCLVVALVAAGDAKEAGQRGYG